MEYTKWKMKKIQANKMSKKEIENEKWKMKNGK
jgi:hypothetical protein